MCARYRVGIIGTGRPWRSEGATGFGMAHSHAQGYLKTDRCDLAFQNGVRATEVIFAAYYSSKVRGRVDLPLAYEGSALRDMMEAGEVGPNRRA